MASVINNIADAVVDILTAAAYLPMECAPARGYSDWALELEDNDTLHLDVIPDSTAIKTTLNTKKTVTYAVPIDIVIRKRFGADHQDGATGRIDRDELDALVELGEAINEQFTPKRLEDFPAGTCHETAILFLPHPMILFEQRQFTGVIRSTFRAEKAVA